MAINLDNPTELSSGVLIADTITVNGMTNYIPSMTKVNGVTVSAALEIQSSLGSLLMPRMTTAQRDALVKTPGMLLFNTTTGGLNICDNTSTWAGFTGAGTVTSVDISTIGTGVTFAGGPITGSGTITATLAANLQSLSNLVTAGLMVRDGANVITRALATGNAANITVSNSQGISGDPTINLATTAVVAGSYIAADITVDAYGRITAAASTGSTGGAPNNATYLIQTANAFLPNAQVMGVLTTGLVKNTTATGVQSIAVAGTDYYSPGNPTRILDDGFANGNFFIGSGAGNLTYTTGQFNTGLGINSLHAIDTGVQNTFAGHSSGILLVSGNFNSGFGELCLAHITNNDANTALGFNAANALATGSGVLALGESAMSACTSATNCMAIGRDTVVANGLTNSAAIGYNTTISVSNGINIGNASFVGFNNASPAYSIDIGAISGVGVIHVPNSTLPATPGSGVLYYSKSNFPYYMLPDGIEHAFTTGTVTSVATGTGLTGGPITTTGTISIANTAVTAASYTVGNFTVNAQGQLTAASSATIIKDTHFSAGDDNLVIGFVSQSNLTGVTSCVSVGNYAGLNLASGADNNVFVGTEAGRNVTTAVNCVAIGDEALLNNKIQEECVAIGTQALQGMNSAVASAGAGNVAVGKSAAFSLTSGTTGTYLGRMAGNSITTSTDSIFLGHLSGATLTTATNCTYVGTNTTGTDSLTNAGAFGYNTNINVSNAINLGSGCQVGINQPSPIYNLDIANISNISATRQATGTAVPTTASAGLLTYTYTAQTSNTTNLALDLLVLPVNKGVTVSVLITGVDTTHTDTTGGNIVASFMRAAGNISMVGAEYNKNVTSTGDFSVSANTGTQAVRLNATGVSGLTYNWTITVQYQIG